MKLVVRILHLVIAALAMVATILLFAMPALSFKSKVVLDVNSFSDLIPSTQYTEDLKVDELLGTDEIQAGISFKLSATEINKVMNGDRDIINERVIVKNLDDTLQILDDAVEVIADYAIRTNLTKIVEQEMRSQIEKAKPEDKTVDEVMEAIDLSSSDFQKFAYSLYDEANKSTATVDTVGSFLQEQIDEIVVKVEKAVPNAKAGSFTEEQKAAVKNNLEGILGQLDMINDDNTIKPISDLPYLYVGKFVKEKIGDKVSESELAQKEGETNRKYSDRLLETFVKAEIPETVYQIIGYVSLGLFIGMFIMAGAWILLVAFEVLHFFFVTKKHRLFKAFFLPLFTLAGIIQIALGFVLTGVCKYILPKKLDISSLNIPVKDALIIPRTCTLATSIVFIITVGVALVLFVLKFFVPKQSEKQE